MAVVFVAFAIAVVIVIVVIVIVAFVIVIFVIVVIIFVIVVPLEFYDTSTIVVILYRNPTSFMHTIDLQANVIRKEFFLHTAPGLFI